jgi:hypothetical protein
MIKYLKVLVILILLVLAILFLIFSPTIFQEGNAIPVAKGIITISLTGNSYSKVDEHKYIVKANVKESKKFIDYLAQNNLEFVDQMGAGVIFKGKNGTQYIAIRRMYTTFFEIWDFNNQTKPGLVLP